MRGARGGEPFFRGLRQNAAQELRYTAFASSGLVGCKHTSIYSEALDRNGRVRIALVRQIEVIHAKCFS
jgi:hypothetical protein